MAKFRVTRPGWVWLLIVAALIGIGLMRRINLLTLLVCPLLVVWGLNALLAGWRLGRLRGKRRIDGPVFAATEFSIEVEVANPHRRGRAAVRLEDGGPSQGVAWFAPRLPGRQTMRFHQTLALPNRGSHTWGPLWAWSSYPFSLVRRGVQLQAEEAIVVLPRLGRLHRGRLRQFLARHVAAAEPIRRAPRHRLATEAEFHGLRTFRHGDSPRWIHWRTTARRGELMVREFEDAPGEHMILVVDPWLPPREQRRVARGAWRNSDIETSGRHHEPLEEAISFAATVCWEWCRQKGNHFLLGIAGATPTVLSGTTGSEHAVRMLECLAVQDGHRDDDGAEIVERLAAVPLPAAPVLLVSAFRNRLGEALARGLNRPVVGVEAATLDDLGFYECPESGRTKRRESSRSTYSMPSEERARSVTSTGG
jgi:uncharacterized protein (DUF58 family)